MRILVLSFILTIISHAFTVNKLSFDSSNSYAQLRQKYVFVRDGHSNYDESFLYPIGWSRRGRFAYIVMTPAGDRDDDIYKFYIQNMVTDKILVKQEITIRGAPSGGAQTLRINDRTVKHLLRRYGIKVQALNFRQFPVFLTSKTIDANVIKKRTYKGNFGREHKFLQYLKVNISNLKNGRSKTIYRRYYNQESDYFDANITGYLRSPFEPRVAVILITVERGWEGAVSNTIITLTGASLMKKL